MEIRIKLDGTLDPPHYYESSRGSIVFTRNDDNVKIEIQDEFSDVRKEFYLKAEDLKKALSLFSE